MKLHKALPGLILLAGLVVSGSALADRHFRSHVGVYFGVPFPYYTTPWPYYAPYPYYPPVIVTQPAPPPVYIQQTPPATQQGTYYWYHCNNPEGYYPYVKSCPGGWEAVVPTPPAQ